MTTSSASHRSFTPAFVAWLVALGVAQSDLDFNSVSEICIALCHVLAIFAPHFLSAQDFPLTMSTGTIAGRQGRLALGLAEWFVARSRPASPVSGDSSAPEQEPSPIPDGIKDRIEEVTNPAVTNRDSTETLLSLSECMLFAAVKSSEKQRFVKAILTLSSDHQNALAHSIYRVESSFATGTSTASSSPSAVLMEADTNRENAPPTPACVDMSPLSLSSKRMITSPHDSKSTPRGISFGDFKTLAEERDSLRRMLTASENEKKSAVQLTNNLKHDLNGASDSLRSMQKKVKNFEEELKRKNKALVESKSALREMQLSEEEVDALRTQAASATQLKVSLKQANEKLKGVSGWGNTIKCLEDQNANYRNNEEYLSKKIDNLEKQLSVSNERAQTLVNVSDELSLSLEAKTGEVRDINSKNRELSQKLETSLDQLAHILMKPSASMNSHPKSESYHDVFQQMASRKLNEELGVHMTWAEMVTCIQNVVVAMSEMEQKPQESVQASQQCDTHIASSEHSFDGSDVRILSDFAMVDSRHELETDADEYEYAADQPGMARRLSQLSTVPEDREGFSTDEDDDVPEPEIVDIPQDTVTAEDFDSSSIHSNSHAGDIVQQTHPLTGDLIRGISASDNLSASIPDEAQELRADSVEPTKDALGLLVEHMMEARADAEKYREEAKGVERELETMRRNLDVMMKENDAAVNKWRDLRSRDAEVVREKDRSIELLEYTIATRDEELTDLRKRAEEAKAASAQIRELKARMASAAEEHAIKMKGQEAEIAMLTAKLTASELISNRLSIAVEKTDNIAQEIQREHKACIRNMSEAARREKDSAQRAWAEAQRVADDCQRALTELVSSQASSASRAQQARSENSSRRHRCSLRVGAFCRKMFQREARNETAGVAVGS